MIGKFFTIDRNDGTIIEWIETETEVKCLGKISKVTMIQAIKKAKHARVNMDSNGMEWYVWIR